MTKKPQVLSNSPALTDAQKAQFDEKLTSFVAGCQAIIKNAPGFKDYKENGGNLGLSIPRLEVGGGNRYQRIDVLNGQRMIFCFVDKTNGDVLKAATYKAPAKGARGNIFDEKNGLGRMQWTGPEYNF